MLPTLRGPRVTLRPIRPDDEPRLREILEEPEVDRWWGQEPPEVNARQLVTTEAETTFTIELYGAVIGAIEFSEQNVPGYRHAGIDVFLSTSAHNRGLGTEAVRTLARYLVTERGHHRLTIDPAASNERAIRSYAKVGFRRVGVMREYELGADGTWHDGLLMDMLAAELTPDEPLGADEGTEA